MWEDQDGWFWAAWLGSVTSPMTVPHPPVWPWMMLKGWCYWYLCLGFRLPGKQTRLRGANSCMGLWRGLLWGAKNRVKRGRGMSLLTEGQTWRRLWAGVQSLKSGEYGGDSENLGGGSYVALRISGVPPGSALRPPVPGIELGSVACQ